ncbi:MAG TPA: hypothetical protein VFH11_03040 [Gemmatimonadota bacterium]|nr:hypothetical protein [Gemmatimonadota bacterium]
MESKSPNTPVAKSCSAARRSSVLALAAALLFTSLFVDVGVARAEYPIGWEDPDLGEIGSCIITCASFFASKGSAAIRYGLAGSCLSCAWDRFVEINDWIQMNDDGSYCYTGMLGNPCPNSPYYNQ